MRHLANAQYWDRPAGGNTGRLFLAFGGPVCADRFSNCPLDRVLTYKNLIYLLNLQISHQRCIDLWLFMFYYLPPAGREIIKRIPCVCSCVIECVSRFYKGLYITLVVSP